MAPLYTLEGVERVFRGASHEVRAVDGVSLEIEAGEFVAIEGPSGSGKSTMLQLLGALDRPSGGMLEFEGTDLGKLSENGRTTLRRESAGFRFPELHIHPPAAPARERAAAAS